MCSFFCVVVLYAGALSLLSLLAVDIWVVSSVLLLQPCCHKEEHLSCHTRPSISWSRIGRYIFSSGRYFQNALQTPGYENACFPVALHTECISKPVFCYSVRGKMVAHCRFKLMFSIVGSLFPFLLISVTIFLPSFLTRVLVFFFLPLYCDLQTFFFFSVCHYLLTRLVCMCFTMFEFMIFGFWVVVRIYSSLWGWASELLNFLHGISILIFFFLFRTASFKFDLWHLNVVSPNQMRALKCGWWSGGSPSLYVSERTHWRQNKEVYWIHAQGIWDRTEERLSTAEAVGRGCVERGRVRRYGHVWNFPLFDNCA